MKIMKETDHHQTPEVVLPCDLPTWSLVQEYLVVLQSAELTSEEMIVAMLRIYDICNISSHPDLPNEKDNNHSADDDEGSNSVDDHLFDDLKQVVEKHFSSRESQRFLSRTLPCMAR